MRIAARSPERAEDWNSAQPPQKEVRLNPSLLYRRTVLAVAAVVFLTAVVWVNGASADDKFFLPPPPPLPGSALAYEVAKDLHEKAVDKVSSVLPLPDLSVLTFLAREANRPLEYLVGLVNLIVPFPGIAATVEIPSRCP